MPSRREFLGLIGISALSRPLGSKLVLRSGQIGPARRLPWARRKFHTLVPGRDV